MARLSYLFSGLLSLAILGGCILVDSFGEYWEKASIDPILEGNWQHVTARGDKVTFHLNSSEDSYYTTSTGTPTEKPRDTIRSLVLENGRLLLLKTSGNTNQIIRYKFSENNKKFTVLEFDDKESARFHHEFASDNIRAEKTEHTRSGREYLHIIFLDDKAVDTLNNMMAIPEMWKKSAVYKRVEDNGTN